MAKIEIYHGSKEVVKTPLFSIGKPYNDYGSGFYCTQDFELAKEWACKTQDDGFVNIYELDLCDLKILDLSSDEYDVMHWIAILLKNRKFSIKDPIEISAYNYILENFLINYSEYDVIIGYRADDSYFSYAQSFISNTISITTLKRAMMLGDLGKQIVLVSEKAYENIKFIKSMNVDKNIYHEKYIVRDKNARMKYSELVKKQCFNKDDVFIMDMLRGGKQ